VGTRKNGSIRLKYQLKYHAYVILPLKHMGNLRLNLKLYVYNYMYFTISSSLLKELEGKYDSFNAKRIS